MKTLNMWQRIAVVLGALWVAGTVAFYWDDFPTRMKVASFLLDLEIKERRELREKTEQEERECRTRYPNDIYLVSCLNAVGMESSKEQQKLREWSEERSGYRFEDLPKHQSQAALKVLLIALLPPILIYLAITWIARAPRPENPPSR